MHKAEPDLLKKKALTDVESLLRRCKEDSEFFKYGLNELSQTEEEFEKSYEDLIVELNTLKTSQQLPTDSELTKLLTPNLSNDSAQLVRIYMGMSHFVHVAGSFMMYGDSEGESIELFETPQSSHPESILKVLSRACAWVLAIQESLLAQDSRIEELEKITSSYGFLPWLNLVSKAPTA